MPMPSDRDIPALSDDLRSELEWTRNWLTQKALPFWSMAGFDRRENLFVERFDFSGEPVEVPHRLMVQCRQIYVFSHATLLNWFDGRDLVERALSTVLTDFRTGNPKAPFAFSLTPRRELASSAVDTYSYAFLLFALAWARRLLGAQVDERLVVDLLSFLRAQLAHPTGLGFIDRLPRIDAFSRQNPQMHLLEALLEIDDVFALAEARALCDDIFGLFHKKLFSREHLALHELHNDHWEIPGDPNAIFEPGHHFEWIWLLDRYSSRTGIQTTSFVRNLATRAFAEGVGKGGAVVESVNAVGGMRVESRRCWATCEGLKAVASNFRHKRDCENASRIAARFLAAIRTCFLSGPFEGGWIDRIDDVDRPLVDHVPASTLYHIFLAVADAEEAFNAAPC